MRGERLLAGRSSRMKAIGPAMYTLTDDSELIITPQEARGYAAMGISERLCNEIAALLGDSSVPTRTDVIAIAERILAEDGSSLSNGGK